MPKRVKMLPDESLRFADEGLRFADEELDSEDEVLAPISPAELRVKREFLGLTGEWFAEAFEIQARTFRRWEAGDAPMPAGIESVLLAVEQQTERLASEAVKSIRKRQAKGKPVTLVVYRTDADFHAEVHLDMPVQLPATWHRALMGRIAYQVGPVAFKYEAPAISAT